MLLLQYFGSLFLGACLGIKFADRLRGFALAAMVVLLTVAAPFAWLHGVSVSPGLGVSFNGLAIAVMVCIGVVLGANRRQSLRR